MQKSVERKPVIEWPAGAKLYLLAIKHPQIVVTLLGAIAGAGISVAFATEHRWKKLIIGLCCGSIFSPFIIPLLNDNPSLSMVMAVTTAVSMSAFTLLEFAYNKENQKNTGLRFWQLVDKRLGLELSKIKNEDESN
jgi:hypothetical protein